MYYPSYFHPNSCTENPSTSFLNLLHKDHKLPIWGYNKYFNKNFRIKSWISEYRHFSPSTDLQLVSSSDPSWWASQAWLSLPFSLSLLHSRFLLPPPPLQTRCLPLRCQSHLHCNKTVQCVVVIWSAAYTWIKNSPAESFLDLESLSSESSLEPNKQSLRLKFCSVGHNNTMSLLSFKHEQEAASFHRALTFHPASSLIACAWAHEGLVALSSACHRRTPLLREEELMFSRKSELS